MSPLRIILILAMLLMPAGAARAAAAPSPTDVFAETLDTQPLSVVAVHFEGRVTSFDSFAYKIMKRTTGVRGIAGRTPTFTLLDMILRPQAYEHASSIYVRKKLLRQSIARALTGRDVLTQAQIAEFMENGLISRDILLGDGPVREVLQRLKSDAMGAAKHVQELELAIALSDPQTLVSEMKLIPPPTADPNAPWHTLFELLAHSPEAGQDAAGISAIDGLPDEKAMRIISAWSALAGAWRMHAVPGEDPAARANEASAALAELTLALHDAAPDTYPPTRKLAWESWYFRWGHMTWVWLVYMVAVALLLAAVVYGWPVARGLGLGVFLSAALLHTAAVGLRWYVSGHWPNSNMFEAVTTAAWMGSIGAIFLEIIARRTPMKNLFALAASVSGAIALMCAHFMPVSLTPEISNRMPILHDVWLYIHTNVIIFSYILIAMAAATSLGYLALRLLGAPADYARGGGAGTLVGMGAATPGELTQKKPSATAVLDGATMILMELSFVLLWAGIIMGAIWADHSWGRPWGWDPKEVFALNTFLVFVLLVHVRIKVRDKGFWTAVLAAAGCGVMVFNWIVINFIISGLHSYA